MGQQDKQFGNDPNGPGQSRNAPGTQGHQSQEDMGQSQKSSQTGSTGTQGKNWRPEDDEMMDNRDQGNSQQETKEIGLATATGFMHLREKKDVYQALSVFDRRKIP